MTKDQLARQASRCPTWCVRQHDEADLDGDRDHLSEVIYSPAIRLLRITRGHDSYRREASAADVVMAIFQGPDEPHPWISIGSSEEREHMELSVDSARRLASDLSLLLEQFSQ
jgi:hypothetical protein